MKGHNHMIKSVITLFTIQLLIITAFAFSRADPSTYYSESSNHKYMLEVIPMFSAVDDVLYGMERKAPIITIYKNMTYKPPEGDTHSFLERIIGY